MTKPSQELLRRAREQRKRIDDGAFGVWSSVTGMESAFYDLAEQVVQECAGIAKGEIGARPREVADAILRKFGLKE